MLNVHPDPKVKPSKKLGPLFVCEREGLNIITMAKLAVSTKSFTTVLLACMLVFSAHVDASITCAEVTTLLIPCISYATFLEEQSHKLDVRELKLSMLVPLP